MSDERTNVNSSPTRRILIVEDDVNLAAGLRYNLERDGYQVDVAIDGATGLASLEATRFDLVILDLMMPGMSGFEVLERLSAQSSTTPPVIILSARDEEVDKVRGFDLGAVDYVTKPFGVGELLARIRVRLDERGERGEPIQAAAAGDDLIQLGSARLDLARMTFTSPGTDEPTTLTPLEVEILRLLSEGYGAPVDRDALCRRIWGIGSGATRTLDAHIARLRKKVELDPAHPRFLVTVHGVGYKLVTS